MCSATQFMVHHIPDILYGDSSDNLFLYIHGKMGRKEEAVRFAEIVCPKGYQVLSIDLLGHGERADEMERFVPWEVVPELQAVYANTQKRWKRISLYANSIGAYFSLLVLCDAKLEKSFLVSPILDMEKLIRDMMGWAGVTQEQLKEAGEISTAFGETLSWKYLTYAEEHPNDLAALSQSWRMGSTGSTLRSRWQCWTHGCGKKYREDAIWPLILRKSTRNFICSRIDPRL